MRRKPYPLNILDRADTILAAWEQIGTNVVIGTIHRTSLTDEIVQVKSIDAQIIEAERRLIGLRNQRDATYVSLWHKMKRIYDSVKGLYGDDSCEYELMGRTPLSKRKPRLRRAKQER